jgi:hypothetical protein
MCGVLVQSAKCRVRSLVVFIALLSFANVAAAQSATEALFLEGRRLFEALDYENAVKALDQAIAALEPTARTDAAVRDRLASAYEMRARSKFGLGDPEGAKADFTALLRLNPNFALTGQVSPRVVSLFDETVAANVTSITLAVTPPTAKLTLDGVPLTGGGTVKVGLGEHVIAAEQAGYRPVKQNFTANAGESPEVTIALERVSAVIHILTSPPDVDVVVNGAKSGRTPRGPAAPEYAEAIAKAGVDPSAVSGALLIADVAPGKHTIDLTRECMVRVSNPLSIDTPADIIIGPIALKPAVATLSVTANESGAEVFIDGNTRGTVPFTTAELCEGDHVVELRSKFGRDLRRITAKTGEKISVEGVLKPTFALVSTSSESGTADSDMRSVIERAFNASRTVALLAPAADESDKALKANQLPAGWLATDPEGRPLGAAGQVPPPVRSDASAKPLVFRASAR